MPLGFLDAFGYHSIRTLSRNDADAEEAREGVAGTLITNIAGYVPGIGVGIAVMRWVTAADLDTESTCYRIGLVVRGIFEFLGLGVVIGLLVDLPVSLHRHCGRREHVPRGFASTNIDSDDDDI